uniref:Putative secreted protein n=1 Tax=Anopheles triannulatus TaxID=58253 RepID=A0A2M4B7N0_9DIPT
MVHGGLLLLGCCSVQGVDNPGGGGIQRRNPFHYFDINFAPRSAIICNRYHGTNIDEYTGPMEPSRPLCHTHFARFDRPLVDPA